MISTIEVPFSSPEDLPRAFTRAWSSKDARLLASFFTEDADFLGLTGEAVDGRQQIAELLAGEMAGAFARARLVTGKVRFRAVGRDVVIVQQRFVLSGIVNADGSDAGRVGAVFISVMARAGNGWLIVSGQFVVES
ncbi:SgcJ/EcaC family oxidoreductase [Thioclava sp. GXIMD2076]|uniref:SgcJ/EcaC family oxidoreductase n=1 Tax=Thioclava kandeliae TaxID=3070818 RepID=A0ABV1SCB7_9RHOB